MPTGCFEELVQKFTNIRADVSLPQPHSAHEHDLPMRRKRESCNRMFKFPGLHPALYMIADNSPVHPRSVRQAQDCPRPVRKHRQVDFDDTFVPGKTSFGQGRDEFKADEFQPMPASGLREFQV